MSLDKNISRNFSENISASFCKKTILILGAGLMQIPAMEAARRMGCRVIAADGNAACAGASYADEFWHINIADAKALAEKAREAHVDGVFTCATDFSFVVSEVARVCGLPALSEDAARCANYKNFMRDRFAEAAVPSCEYQIIDCAKLEVARADISGIASMVSMGFPLVVKPVDNMGARGVRMVRARGELDAALAEAARYSPSGLVIAEQKLSGPELSIDSLVADGESLVLGIADRHIAFAPYFVETGHSIPSSLSEDAQDDACAALHKAAQAVGIENGACKGDIIFHEGSARVGECAARLSGGYMSGWTIPYAYGIDCAKYAVEFALLGSLSGESKSALRAAQKEIYAPRRHVAERALISLPGTLRAIRMSERLAALSALPIDLEKLHTNHEAELCNVIITAQVGSKRTLPHNNTDKSGSVIAIGTSAEVANDVAIRALAGIFFEVERNAEAESFLYADINSASRARGVDAPEEKPDEALQEGGAWYCYPRAHEACAIVCAQDEAQLTKAFDRCKKQNALRVFLPGEHDLGAAAAERGAWTHCTALTGLQVAAKYIPMEFVARREDSINMLALRAFLRGGWQGLHYTLQLVRTCSGDICGQIV